MRKKIAGFAIAIFGLMLAVPSFLAFPVAQAQGNGQNVIWGSNYTANDFQNTLGLGDEDPRDIAASVIRILLGFLGMIAVVIILLGGFKWMTAGGNEEKVGEARKLIIQGAVGLIIILAAFGIANFVINNLLEATNN
ncbi:hypothetical protein IPN41_00325 [Candidatus Falkowbacteria bacterium]|nr:MAG: hypothetical protein IPN41_00325 [Candidatus Falkowbacteria bacterium]